MTTVELEKFKRMYFSEFGIALTDEDAERQARLLVQIYKVVYGSPTTTQNHESQIRGASTRKPSNTFGRGL